MPKYVASHNSFILEPARSQQLLLALYRIAIKGEERETTKSH
jgi:hypothetical protein